MLISRCLDVWKEKKEKPVRVKEVDSRRGALDRVGYRSYTTRVSRTTVLLHRQQPLPKNIPMQLYFTKIYLLVSLKKLIKLTTSSTS